MSAEPRNAETTAADDKYEEYQWRRKPYRGGILADSGLRDKKLSKARLLVHAQAVDWQLFHAVEDLVSSWRYSRELNDRISHLERRCSLLYNAANAYRDSLIEQNVDPDVWSEIDKDWNPRNV